LSSWRWLLILEGGPAIFGGILCYFLLPNRPQEAKFLADSEKGWIEQELERDGKTADHLSAVETLHNRRVWHLAVIGFTHAVGTYSISFWLPLLTKSLLGAQSNTVLGFLLTLPYLVALTGMMVVSRHSDRTLERRYHVAACAVAASMALIALGTSHDIFFSVGLLSIAALGTFSLLPVFFALPGEFLTGFSAASGIALITSIANLGGFAGPYAVGLIRDSAGSLYAGIGLVGVSLFTCALLALFLPKRGHAVLQTCA
jgi:MFS transporter, ACS family, tartrate transporter